MYREQVCRHLQPLVSAEPHRLGEHARVGGVALQSPASPVIVGVAGEPLDKTGAVALLATVLAERATVGSSAAAARAGTGRSG